MLVLASCQSVHEIPKSPVLSDVRLNLLHAGDNNLAGVAIYRNDPVNMNDDPPRSDKYHPFAVVYYFWEGSYVHDVAYNNEGKVVRSTWVNRYTPISKAEWNRVDFSYGSDPTFKRHADPRM